ncbi:MAG: flavodoxin family protein [Pseudomonadota bacterium]
MTIEILYASETCTSEMLSYDLESVAKEYADCRVRNMDQVKPEDISPGTLYVMLVSTHGDGELPIPGELFASKIRKEDPDYTGVLFAVFGLGDTVYEATYNWGCKTVADLMTQRNATLLGEIGLHDASELDEPEDIAVPWLTDILDTLARDEQNAAPQAHEHVASLSSL